MYQRFGIAILCTLLCTSVFADEQPAVTQGTNQYDWQTCVGDKTNDCINDCANSDEINCQNNCVQLAKDKCQSQGLTPPQQ